MDLLCVVLTLMLCLAILMVIGWLAFQALSVNFLDKPDVAQLRNIGHETRQRMDLASDEYLITVLERFKNYEKRLDKEQENEREK